MTNWKFTDNTNSVVFRTNDAGLMESCLVEAIADWIAEGNTPEPADITVTVIPSIVSMRQARLALLQAGLLSTVNAAIAAGGDSDKIEWEYAADVDRNSPLVQNMKAGLSLTDADLDNLFTLAASL